MTPLLRRLFRETLWTVGLAEVGEEQLEAILLGRRDLSDVPFRWLSRRGHSFVADPFVFSDGERLLLAFEDFRARTGRGVVSVREVGADLSPGARVVHEIAEPHHLAFPSPVVLDGRVHLVPDAATKTLLAYPLAGGPPVRLDGPERLPCTDPCVVTVGEQQVVLASDPDGQLWAYELVASAGGGHEIGARTRVPGAGRLAGGVVAVRGRYFRLQQNSSDGYGSATDVFEIDPAAGDFAGVHRTTVTAPTGRGRERWDGTHHLSHAGGVLAVDVRRRRFSVVATPLKVWYRLRSGG